MDVVALIARIALAFIFLGAGFSHLTSAEAMAPYAAAKKLPQPKLAVQASGAYMLVAALLLVLGIWPDLAALALVPFLLLTAVIFHDFWRQETPEARQLEQIQFSKNLSLTGGALAVFVLYASDPHPGLTLLDPLF
ncbi:putative membrane protein YphA (DoxX/SURF4 family) [Actinomadura pelletieri DSM 43383]|uniref:Putative membrane protein YphA (DoxX/SURF4 family) n=1 Tax=Actinomadura pelletieri DSM 43383 TaxID=1120940 RepID=A0A495QNK8_9ACTN|nr:DoxX family protein [Actinomadura pelletieri]RKS74568.1 putative membrane protein YphA (DoxX/SURF4 family) [Actinomadura pelletieri DSM 43383]